MRFNNLLAFNELFYQQNEFMAAASDQVADIIMCRTSYSWIAMTSSTDLSYWRPSDKIFTQHQDNLVLKCLCKVQVNTLINARVTVVRSLENLCTFILWRPCWQAKECPPAHFQQKNSPMILLLWLINLFSLVQITSNLIQIRCMVL